MAATDLREPHDSHVIKYSLFSFVKLVSGDLQVLQVTYSIMYLLNTFSICFCWNLPLITNL